MNIINGIFTVTISGLYFFILSRQGNNKINTAATSIEVLKNGQFDLMITDQSSKYFVNVGYIWMMELLKSEIIQLKLSEYSNSLSVDSDTHFYFTGQFVSKSK